MHGLILAGGEGARLAADGVPAPKALARVAGRPQLLALAEQLATLGCASVTCVVNEDVAASLARTPSLAVTARRLAARARVVECRTPSSLHTLAVGLACMPPGDVLCSMVDTVMAPADWRLVYEAGARGLASGAVAVLAVTPYDGGDDAPLWAQLTPRDAVSRLGGAPSAPPRVTGGVYAFGAAARARVPAALAAGRHRMRAFLADLVDSGADVRAVEVACIVDVDHKRDLERANAYLASRASVGPGSTPDADH